MIRLLEAHPSGRAKARSLNKFSVEQLRWFASCEFVHTVIGLLLLRKMVGRAGFEPATN